MIMHDVEQRFVDLADVVKERDALDGVHSVLVEPGLFGDDQRVGRDAANMLPVSASLASMALSSVSRPAAANRSTARRARVRE